MPIQSALLMEVQLVIRLKSESILPIAIAIAATFLGIEPAVAQIQADAQPRYPSVIRLSQPFESASESVRPGVSELQVATYELSLDEQIERRQRGHLGPRVTEYENRFGDRGFLYPLVTF